MARVHSNIFLINSLSKCIISRAALFESVEVALHAHEFLVVALLLDGAILHHDDLLGVFDGADPVSDG